MSEVTRESQEAHVEKIKALIEKITEYRNSDVSKFESISNPGYYNKADFINMIYSYCGLGVSELSDEEMTIIKKNVKQLREEKESLLKQYKILKSKKTAANYLSSISDKSAFDDKVRQLEKINDKIAELRKERNIAATRKAKWETTVKELRSLNRTIDCGELRCMECNSTNILFSTSKKSLYTFDVSSVDMRNEILDSMGEKISSYNEEIDKISSLISKEQEYLQEVMKDESISLESIVAYKSQIFDAASAEIRIKEIDVQINQFNTKIQENDCSTKEQKENQKHLYEKIVSDMIDMYTTVDPNSNSVIDGIFTKKDEVFSGSVFDGVRYMTKTEREKCHGIPVGYTKNLTENEAADVIGDGWAIDVIAHIFSFIK